jgi:diketogulonate reductase-like aldo/keto reductase
MDPVHLDAAVVAMCREEGILYQAYSSLRSLASGADSPEYTEAANTIRQLAEQRNCTPAQVRRRVAAGGSVT